MKTTFRILSTAMLTLALTACGSSSSAATSEKASEAEKETSAEPTEETKEETKEEAAWETGEGRATVWTDSIGSKWVQIICPVTNTGTKNLYLSAGTMDLEDTDGNLVDSKTMVSVFPEVIQPGETGYYYEETTLSEDSPEELTVVPHVKVDEAKVDCLRLTVSDVNITDEDYMGIKVTGRVENDTEEEAKLVYVTAFLYDADNNLLASVFTILPDALPAGEKIGFSASGLSLPDSITADMVDHYEAYAYPQQFQF